MEAPSRAEVVVVGTGLVEAMVAAACARVGLSVLHLDAHPFYGSRHATFDLPHLSQYLRTTGEDKPAHRGSSPPIPPSHPSPRSLGVVPLSHAPARVSYYGGEPYAIAGEHSLESEARRYNLDLSPQLLLCAGGMIELLRQSGVGAYLEFKLLSSHLFARGEEPPQRVPCSKGEIFNAPSIPLRQKRQLMKFLQSCLALQPSLDASPADAQSWLAGRAVKSAAAPDAPPLPVAPSGGGDGESFASFAERQGLPEELLDLALFAILQLPARLSSPDALSAEEGVRGVCTHLKSLGVYGPTAYLTNNYGSSELPQAFCRLCAVWGGTYMIDRQIRSVLLRDDDKEGPGHVDAVVTSEGRVGCEWLVINADAYLHDQPQPPPPPEAAGTIARCVCDSRRSPAIHQALSSHGSILDRPLLGGEGEELNLTIHFPPEQPGARAVFVVQQDESLFVCPKGRAVLHLSAQGSQELSPEQLLLPVLEKLLSQGRVHTEPPPSAEETPPCPPEGIPSPPEPPAVGEGQASSAPSASEETPTSEVVSEDGSSVQGAPLFETSEQQSPPPGPKVLWGAFFDLPLRRCLSNGVLASTPSNLIPVDDSPLTMSFDSAAENARKIFERICPTQPFLPSVEDCPPPQAQNDSMPENEKPKFIETNFTSKVEYERWLQSGNPLPREAGVAS